jgi:hypothetical protein
MKPIRHLIEKSKLSSQFVRGAITADRADAIPASTTRRLLALLIGVPCINLGYWLAWPGLKLSSFGHKIMAASLHRNHTFRKN